MQFIALEQLINLYDGYRRRVVFDRQEWLLLQSDGEVFLIQANCPHMQWPLDQAAISADTITCQKHRFAFNLRSGCAANQAASQCNALKTLPLSYDGNQIGVWR
ncbi:MAG: Rieske 2Fe-2S domain-containing protein [Pseudomonadales bacterium]|nr:Rieske 2Fe-2S domain-containing protein [Pseudomonadales bacterium]